MKVRTAVGLAIAALGVAAGGCAIPIDDLGGPTSIALGINDAGVIVGASELAGDRPVPFTGHAFKRMPDRSVVDLGTLPGHDNSEARAINASGTATGISYGSWTPTPGDSWPPSLASHAVVWDPSGQVVDLGTLDGELTSEPRDINAAGVVVGESGRRAFVFDPEVGHMVALPEISGAIDSVALGVNDHGIAVGYTYLASGPVVGVRWNLPVGTVEDLSSSLDVPFVPRQINNRGTMAGEVAGGAPTSRRAQAAIVPEGTTTPINLGVSPTETSFAPGLNEDDVVVGVHYLDSGGFEGFRWSAADGVQRFTDAPTSMAFAINGAGTIVGMADDRAVILVPTDDAPAATTSRRPATSAGQGRAAQQAGSGGFSLPFPVPGAFERHVHPG